MRTTAEGRALHVLRSVVAVHRVEPFDVPRPRALLGQANLDRLVATASVLIDADPTAFRTLRLSAAGADSAVLMRFQQELAERLGLSEVKGGGDLVLALRRSGSAWEVLLRTTPRPLSARAWRVCDLPGALNATAAHAMAVLGDPRPDETFVNIACGSATLLIERLALAPARLAIGYDSDAEALRCARLNLEASGHTSAVELVQQDARQLPLASGSVRTVVADLPFAMRMGSAATNAELYAALLGEAARVLTADGRCVVVTTQHRLMQRILSNWNVEAAVPFELSHARGTFNPTIFVLRKR
jgi:tRNA (guanine6-N2)-methyltransferase